MTSGTPTAEPVFKRVWILGFAGHRSLADPAAIGAAIRTALESFRLQVDGMLVGRSSAADGSDLLFMEACRELGMKYSVVLPFPEERFREDFPDDTRWAHAKFLMDHAVSVEIAPGHESAPEAYHLASRELIDVADAMLFVWDGKPARGIGGTEETIADARDRGMPVQIIDADSGEIQSVENAPTWPWRDPDFKSLPKARGVEELFHALDQRATTGAPRSRLLAAGVVSLNQIAVLIAGVLVACGRTEESASVVKLAIVAAAAILPWVGKRQRLSEQWHDDRVRAELLRSLLASHDFAPPLRPFAAELSLSDTAFLRSASWRLYSDVRSWQDAKSVYLKERLDGQISYLETKGKRAAERLTTLTRAFKVSSFGALIFSAAASLNLLAKLPSTHWTGPILKDILPVLLPASAAWCIAMIALYEHKRRSSLYCQIVESLRIKRLALANAKSRVTAATVISSVERLLLTELWEWGESSGKRR